MDKNKRCELLWQEFLEILDRKTHQDVYFTGLSDEINRVKKKLYSEKDEIKRALILEALIDAINIKIKCGASAEEVINSMAAHVYDEKVKLKNYNSDFKNATISKIEEFYDGLDGYTRPALFKLEEEYSDLLKNKTSVFGQKLARGQIIGDLNIGMYGATKETIIRVINENGGKLHNNDKLLSYMGVYLLKFRVIALRMVAKYCDKSLEHAKERAHDMDEGFYEEMRNKTQKLGSIIREYYNDYFYIDPLAEIILNVLGPDTKAFDYFYPDDDNKKKHK